MIKELMKDAQERMDKAIEATRREFAKIRTGKATVALLDNIKVDYYGVPTPLSQVANLGAPETRLLTIQPWEKKMLPIIEKAIFESDLGITPTNDGNIIRLPIPALTEERRRELVKVVHKLTEEGKVAVRNIRRDALGKLKNAEKDSEIRQDELYRAQEDLQELTDNHVKKMDELMQHKEEEIMEV